MNPNFNLSSLRKNTKNAFLSLAKTPLCGGFVLIGGTALAVQIQHRISEDLDFCTWEKSGKLPTERINALISDLSRSGHQVKLITNPTQESSFRINTGELLSDYARDYLLNDVKLTFFAASKTRHPKRFEFLQVAPLEKIESCSFQVMSIDALKLMKSVILEDRVKSRDLFDLMILMKNHDYSIEDFCKNIQQYGDLNNDPEYHFSILRGSIPLDKDDEGLESLGPMPTVKEMYQWFDLKIQTFQSKIHRERLTSPSG